jgi:hypothetical protein
LQDTDSSTALCLNRIMAVAGIPELCGVTIEVLELGITLTPRIGASLSWARLFSRSCLHIVARVRNPQPDTEKSGNPDRISIYHEDSRATSFQICHPGYNRILDPTGVQYSAREREWSLLPEQAKSTNLRVRKQQWVLGVEDDRRRRGKNAG